ncbi:hypothetical protein [Blackfly microvirus SF02]|uniref:Uncharacterized protein n=1 Tax=Blackfly microvirus SF02 TaxID=2576452 RepID=A0A4V1F5G8_9VIRU|nr:hypothetical protein [Blackfly microvirus SF02]
MELLEDYNKALIALLTRQLPIDFLIADLNRIKKSLNENKKLAELSAQQSTGGNKSTTVSDSPGRDDDYPGNIGTP